MTARWITPLLALFIGLSNTTVAKAADASSVAGKWKSTTTVNGNERTTTFTFKVDGDKITGTVSGGGRGGAAATETDISEATFKDGTLSFEVTRERNGNKFTTKYSGKLDGDTIKGTIERPGRNGGDPVKTDWEAKRDKAAA